MSESAEYCEKCGAPLPADFHYCEKCGNPVMPQPEEAVSKKYVEASSPQPLQSQRPPQQVMHASPTSKIKYLIGGGIAIILILLAGISIPYFLSVKVPADFQKQPLDTSSPQPSAAQDKTANTVISPPEKAPPDVQKQTSRTTSTSHVCASIVTLFDNWNTGGCATTNMARGRLSKKALTTKIVLWSDTSIEENSLNGILKGLGVYLPVSTQRGNCQGSWCEEIVQLNEVLPAGDYTFQTNLKSLCQNSASSGIGYIRFEGCTRP